ncbi:restriction endonuclease [Leptospira meyeri]|uniref:restriction endonuclease n=1 Tax=Leptospira meyeri TaxID=29508 RepID=UPI00223DD0AD|nr:restriction endonuclease [Leptospira meyeri]MCW7490916.1 restriction endonuclease [Leptospira meyeri]
MEKERIIKLLNTLPEHKMAKEIFVPVLKAMGSKGVKFTGGPEEEGIDIEYYYLSQPDNQKMYVGVQFKKSDIKYGAGGNKNTVKEIKNQAEEAFDKELHDIDGKGVHYITRFIVATTGDINEPARKYIGKARLKGNDRNIDYWVGDRLAEYIQQYWLKEFIEYFKITETDDKIDDDELEIVTEDYLAENYSDLIKKCNRIKSATSITEWEILETIAINNGGINMGDLLIELGKAEDYLEADFHKLASKDFVLFENDDSITTVSLTQKTEIISTLFSSIQTELHEADQSEDSAEELFRLILK